MVKMVSSLPYDIGCKGDSRDVVFSAIVTSHASVQYDVQVASPLLVSLSP